MTIMGRARQPRLARQLHRAPSPTASPPARLCDHRAMVGSRRALVGWTASVAAGRANHLYVWEAPSTPACAGTSGAEARRAALALFASRAIAGHGRFSLVLRFVARSAEKHRLCAYLVNRRSGKTFARAEAAWTNVAPPPPSAGALQPAAVGSGLCPARKFPD